MRKVFPDHWTFMLGEIALWSFVILLLTGTYLALFFKPSMAPAVYHGSYAKLDGITMSQAYASTLNISFDIRGGLLIRQVHHWAADLFMIAICAHMLRHFFLGSYRKPRDVNWLIGIVIFAAALVEGLFGYSLPDDQLSGAGLRIFEGVLQGIPVIGTYAAYFLFGGAYPGHDIVPRMYVLHVLLIPGLILALVTAHVFLTVPPEAHRDARARQQRALRQRAAVLPVLPAQGDRVVLLHLRRAGGPRDVRADQPDLAVRPLHAAGDLLGQPARLVPGHTGGRAAGHARLGG